MFSMGGLDQSGPTFASTLHKQSPLSNPPAGTLALVNGQTSRGSTEIAWLGVQHHADLPRRGAGPAHDGDGHSGLRTGDHSTPAINQSVHRSFTYDFANESQQ